MKRLLFFLSLLLFFGQLSAQRYTPMPTWYEFFQVKFKDHLQVPILKKTTSDSALLAYGDRKLWIKTDTGWTAVGGADVSKVPLTRTVTINGTTYDLTIDRTWTITKTDVGLSNVDNTADLNKPISIAQQAALNDSAAAIRSAIGAAIVTANGWGLQKVGTEIRMGGTLPGTATINFQNTGQMLWQNMLHMSLSGPTSGGSLWFMSSNSTGLNIVWERDKARRAISIDGSIPNGGLLMTATGVPGFGNGATFRLDTLGRFYLAGMKPTEREDADSVLMWHSAYGQVKYRSLSSFGFASQSALDDTVDAIRAAITTPSKIVIGDEVDPLYPLSVKKVYDHVTQENFATTVAKYPFYADKHVMFDEDSVSFWQIPGDNAGLFGLRYKGRSIVNMENTVNRFTASHSVLFLEKYPGFNDTTIFKGRVSPLTGISPPTGFSAIVSQSQSGLTSANPNIGKGWFSALTAEWQMGGTNFNKQENAIWLHTGILGAAPGAITNGYALYINGFGSGVINKYAIFQQGILDTSFFAGKIRFFGLTGTGNRLPILSSAGVLGAIANGSDGQQLTMVSGSPAWSNNTSVQLSGNQTVSGVKSFTDRMVITKGAGITPDANNVLYLGRNEPGNFYPLGVFEDKTDDGYSQFGVWGKNRKWNFGVGNGPSSFFGVQDKFYVLDATSNNIRFSIDPAGTVEVPELLMAKGNVATRARTITSSTTIDKYDHTLFIDASSGPVTVTLPTSSSSYYAGYGITYTFKRIDGSGNTITIQAAGGDTIDGAASIGLNTSALQTITIQAAGGTAWYIIKN